MFDTYKLKVVFWNRARAHFCTLAVAFSLNSLWRVPRDGYRYGGLAFGLLLTLSMTLVALPAALLQLSVGQLSQQDAIGVWRAVPFFKGIGYIRLLISYLGSVCTIIYVAVSALFFMFTLNNSIPFDECNEFIGIAIPEFNVSYASSCFNQTIFAPINEKPEFYMALLLVTIFLWIIFPFVLYYPVKAMKRIFYVLGPVSQVVWIVIVFCIGDTAGLQLFSKREDWSNFLKPEMWNTAIARGLLTAQVAGGYLISSGDSIYSNSDVEWTSISFVATNIASAWFGLLVWFAIGTHERDHTIFAVIAQIYNATVERNLAGAWPLIIFASLLLSGVISVITLLYPFYDRFRRVGGHKWRYLSVGSSVIGAGLSAAALVDHSALAMLEDIVLPFLINVTTVIEISAFVFIYGWKVLLEDMEFLAGRQLMRFWVWGWCAVPGMITPFVLWWYITSFLPEPLWTEPPWSPSALVAATATVIFIFITLAIIAVARQVQYDVLGKLKSSFKPSRHWGPRDPIAHYYWLARRENINDEEAQSRYNRRYLGQFSDASSFLSISKVSNNDTVVECKRRSNSDDWLYNYRKDYLTEMFNIHFPNRRRAKSLDWPILKRASKVNRYTEHKNTPSCDTTPSDSIVVVENITTIPQTISRH